MKKIEENLQPDKDYRELFTVDVDELKCTDTVSCINYMKHKGDYIL